MVGWLPRRNSRFKGAPTDPPADGWAEECELIAFHGSRGPVVPVVPADRGRPWMPSGHPARRCLPLLMANEGGWFILNTVGFTATWNGGDKVEAVTFDVDESGSGLLVESLFGFGIISFTIPYLFRTPSGVELLARGPANWPKDGACALEGLVETDWAVATFTMNWKLTRPEMPVRFDVDEPFCMIVPQTRDSMQSWRPTFREVSQAPETKDLANQWQAERHQLLVRGFLRQQGRDMPEDLSALELQYFRGLYPDGRAASEHRTRAKLRPFGSS